MSKVKLDRQAAEARLKRAFDLAWIGRPRKPRSALKELRLALALDPGLAMAHLQIGNILNSFGEHRCKEAKAEFEEVIRLAPQWVEGYGHLAHGLWDEGQREEAIGAFVEATRLAPDDNRWWVSLGARLSEMGRYDEAIPALEKGLSIKHMSETASRWFLADAYHRAGRIDDAIAQWKIMDRDGATWDYEKWSVADAR